MLSKLLFEQYANRVENLEHEFQNVSGILLSIVNAVTVVNDKLSSTYSNVHQYVYYEEGQLKNGILQIDDPFNQTFSSLLSNVKQEEVNNSGIMQQTIVYEKDETISARHLKMKLRIPDKSIYYEVEAFEKAAILRNQIRRLLHLKDSFPNIPEDDVFDRGIKESEILSFTSLSIQDFHRFNQLRIFEDFLKDVNESIPNFTGLLKLQQGSDRSVLKRQHSRQLSASIFSKILSYELNHSDPKVLLRYYPLTDQLLYALCWPPPTRRHVRSTVTLPDYFNMENSRVPSSTKQKKSNISSRASSPTDDVAEKLTVAKRVSVSVDKLSGAHSSVQNPGSPTKKSRSVNKNTEKAEAEPPKRDKITIHPAGGEAILEIYRINISCDSWVTYYPGDGTVIGMNRGDDFLPSEMKRMEEQKYKEKVAADEIVCEVGADVQKKKKKGFKENVRAITATMKGLGLGSKLKHDESSPQQIQNQAHEKLQIDTDVNHSHQDGENMKKGKAKGDKKKEQTPKQKSTAPTPKAVAPTPKSTVPTPKSVATPKSTTAKKNSKAKVEEDVAKEEALAVPVESTSEPVIIVDDHSPTPPVEAFAVLPPTSAKFFLHTLNDVRYVVEDGPFNVPNLKPDECGTIAIQACFPSGLQVKACTNGDIRFIDRRVGNGVLNPSLPKKDFLGDEISRFITARNDGTVSRTLKNGPFKQDILLADGSRILVKNTKVNGNEESLRLNSSSGSITQLNQKKRMFSSGKKSQKTRGLVSPSQKKSSEKNDNNNHSTTPEKTNRLSSDQSSAIEDESIGFYKRLFTEINDDHWNEVHLQKDGSVVFYYVKRSEIALNSDVFHLPIPSSSSDVITKIFTSKKNILNHTIDDESRCEIFHYDDGRLFIQYPNGQRECTFPDATVMTTSADGSMLFVTKDTRILHHQLSREDYCHFSLPSIEMNIEYDKACRSHANGHKLPLKKSGERVRSKIALPDGSAMLIKYNTSITAYFNGSIKVVQRDRQCLTINDNGDIHYHSPQSWTRQAEEEFQRDINDYYQNQPPQHYVTSAMSRNRVNFSDSITNTLESASSSTLTDKKHSHTKNISNEMTQEIAMSEPSQQLLFSANIHEKSCNVKDIEHNEFTVNLYDALNPVIKLSGEVEGLLPVAIVDKSIDPRLFIISRSGDAIEMLSKERLDKLDSELIIKKEASKFVSMVPSQPIELGYGSTKLYSFFNRKRLGIRGDDFSFEEVFSERSWLKKKKPAKACHILSFPQLQASRPPYSDNQEQQSVDEDELESSFRENGATTYEAIHIVEHEPLSQEGYKLLANDFDRWLKFCEDRTSSIDRFKVDEWRSKEQLDQEEKMRQRLKQVYKHAKAQQKRKENQNVRRISASKDNPEDLHSDIDGAGLARVDEIDESDDERSQNSGGASIFDSDDEKEDSQADTEENDIRAAFEEFAIADTRIRKQPEVPSFSKLPDGASRSFGGTINQKKFIPRHQLRSAIIQIRNGRVAQANVDKAIATLNLENRSMGYSLNEFRFIYFNVCQLQDVDDDLKQKAESKIHTNKASKTVIESRQLNSLPRFWKTSVGKITNQSIPLSPPPLQHRPVVWTPSHSVSEAFKDDDTTDMSNHYDGVVSNAAGSAVNVARLYQTM